MADKTEVSDVTPSVVLLVRILLAFGTRSSDVLATGEYCLSLEWRLLDD
jgi:hypothetical protein